MTAFEWMGYAVLYLYAALGFIYLFDRLITRLRR